MPRNPSNRIEVDLKLLQDANVEKLQAFGAQFNKSIETLATLVGSWGEQVKGAQGINKPGSPGPDASEASAVRVGGTPARLGGTFANAPSGSGTYPPYPTEPGGSGLTGTPSIAVPQGTAETFEQQYVRATRRIGEYPIGPRQWLGYFAEGGPGPGEPSESASMQKARGYAGRMNTALFNMQAVKANMMLGAGKVQDFFGTQQGYTALGQSLGRSREGGFLGIGNSAWTTGLEEQLKTGMSADFGFNPYYSLKQAQEARSTLQGYGYSGNTSDALAGMLKQLQIHQGVDAKSAMSVLDPFMRFGGPESLGQLTNILQQIPNAAYAAKMNLQEFTQELVQTAQQVAQTTGMTVGNAASGLSAFSAVTGLAPSRAAQVMTDPTAAWMAVGLTHSNLWDVTNGPHATSDRFKIFQDRFNSVTGMSAGQILNLAHTNHAKFAQVMSRVQALYMQDPNFFGGLSPREWLNSQTRNQGHTVGNMAIQESIGQVGISDKKMDSLLKGWNGGGIAGANMSKQFETWEAKHPLDKAKSWESNEKAAQAFAESLLKHQQRSAATRAANQITLALTPEAAKYFKLLPQDASQKNDVMGVARKAIGGAANAVRVAGEVASFIPGI